ncbi:MAG: hypothetical protein DBX44_05010 [Oscillospiraceae bacterium]|nr:MAG: hypothetical protein DBX44_05010 [Oscillospiraceae bacterium]
MERQEDQALLRRELASLCEGSRYPRCAGLIQHGTTSVYQHCAGVAWISLRLARRLGWKVNTRALVRAALLHDYFLYDWHLRGQRPRWHGFTHPRRALCNALEEFDLGAQEQDAILRHMFPLTLLPPRSRIGWLICLADKWCGLCETLRVPYSWAPVEKFDIPFLTKLQKSR